jgi:hypothetical protein
MPKGKTVCAEFATLIEQAGYGKAFAMDTQEPGASLCKEVTFAVVENAKKTLKSLASFPL